MWAISLQYLLVSCTVTRWCTHALGPWFRAWVSWVWVSGRWGRARKGPVSCPQNWDVLFSTCHDSGPASDLSWEFWDPESTADWFCCWAHFDLGPHLWKGNQFVDLPLCIRLLCALSHLVLVRISQVTKEISREIRWLNQDSKHGNNPNAHRLANRFTEMQHIHTREYYLALKRNEGLMQVTY